MHILYYIIVNYCNEMTAFRVFCLPDGDNYNTNSLKSALWGLKGEKGGAQSLRFTLYEHSDSVAVVVAVICYLLLWFVVLLLF